MEKGNPGKGPAVDVDSLIKTAVTLSGLNAVVHELKDADLSSLRSLSDQVRTKLKGESVCALFSVSDGAVSFVVTSSTVRIDAGALTKKIAALLEGSGGGKKDFAQGGSKNTGKVDAAKKQIPQLLQEFLAQPARK